MRHADRRAHDRPEAPPPNHDRGLAFDLSTLSRRRALTLGGVGLVGAALAGCTWRPGGGTGPTTTVPPGSCAKIPQETGGPFPGDGTNGPNVLNQSGIVRSDIRKSIGGASGMAAGVPLTIKLRVLSTANKCGPLAGAAVYAWHCDAVGRYSMYSAGANNENYLRGVQAADADGELTFTSIFPAAYTGRWPHVHFEIYPNVTAATGKGTKLRTTQLALPEDICREVYAGTGYDGSLKNLAATPLARDMVFADGYSLQMATMSGDVASGLTASLDLPV